MRTRPRQVDVSEQAIPSALGSGRCPVMTLSIIFERLWRLGQIVKCRKRAVSHTQLPLAKAKGMVQRTVGWRRVLCLSRVRLHLRAVSFLGPQAEGTLIKQRSRREATGPVGLEHSPCEEGLQGWGWLGLEHRQHHDTEQENGPRRQGQAPCRGAWWDAVVQAVTGSDNVL